MTKSGKIPKKQTTAEHHQIFDDIRRAQTAMCEIVDSTLTDYEVKCAAIKAKYWIDRLYVELKNGLK